MTEMDKYLKTYLEELQERVDQGTKVEKTSIMAKVLIGIAVGGFVLFLGLAGINYVIHNGPQERAYVHETVYGAKAKTTGLMGYVVYRKLIMLEDVRDGDVYYNVDMIVKGHMLKRNERYFDIDGDKGVDRINPAGLERERDYKENKVKFDKADKFFARHIKELSN